MLSFDSRASYVPGQVWLPNAGKGGAVVRSHEYRTNSGDAAVFGPKNWVPSGLVAVIESSALPAPFAPMTRMA
jgi:hypothetical protein